MSLFIASLSEHTGPVNGSCLYFVALTPKDPEPVVRQRLPAGLLFINKRARAFGPTIASVFSPRRVLAACAQRRMQPEL
jgi:hypothetical protein